MGLLKKRYRVRFIYMGDDPLTIAETYTFLGAWLVARTWEYADYGMTKVEKIT